MPTDMSRFHAELQRLTGEAERTIIPAGATGQIRSVYNQNALSAAIVDGKWRVAEVIAKADDQLAVDLHAGVLQTAAQMEKEADQYQGKQAQDIADLATSAFPQQKLAHNLAYYQAFGDHAMKEMRREITVPPPQRRWRLFSSE